MCLGQYKYLIMEVHARSSFRHPYRQVETFHSQVYKSAYSTGMVRPRCTPCTFCAFKLTDSHAEMEASGLEKWITTHAPSSLLYIKI